MYLLRKTALRRNVLYNVVLWDENEQKKKKPKQ